VAGVMFIRADDHLVIRVRWIGFTLKGTGSAMRLTAGPQARLLIVLPPQHVGEESSSPGSPAPLQLPAGAGATVPTWRGVLSAPTRLTFRVSADVQIPLTVDGILTAVLNNPIVAAAGVPGPDDSAIELPWRLVIAPSGRSSGIAVCRHLTRPPAPDSSGLWRTRVVDPDGADPLVDAGLILKVVDEETANSADPETFAPGNALPLARDARVRLFTETSTQSQLTKVSRLELSALGGTLDASARFPSFEWDHRAVLGRDMHVRTLSRGVMYPFGHRAEVLTVTERLYDPAADGAAVLRTTRVLTIVEPVRRAPADGRIRRAFPLGDIEITRTLFTDLAPDVRLQTSMPGHGTIGTHFWPSMMVAGSPKPILFPIRCTTATGAVTFDVPLLFVDDMAPTIPTLTSPDVARQLEKDYPAQEVKIHPTNIDLAGAATRDRKAGDVHAGDVHEVRALKIGGAKLEEGLALADGYRSKLTELEIGLPALRVLAGNDSPARVAFDVTYLQNGAEDVLLKMVGDAVPVDFSKAADRSGGLLAPKYAISAISRSMGPVDGNSLPDAVTGFIDPARLFPADDATLLGFPLKSLLTQLKLPPQITAMPIPNSAPEVKMQWTDVKLTSAGPFKATNTTKLDLTVTTAPSTSETVCTVKDFALELPPGPKRVLRLSFAGMTFSQSGGTSPRLDVKGVNAEFLGDLSLLKQLASAVDLEGAGKLIDVKPTGLAVRYSLPIPSISAGAFVMRNMVFTAGIEVPFNGDPVLVRIGFASRVSPFQLGVMMFGGGGYIELALDRDGLRRFEASLEFGAFIAVDFVVASGEVHALGSVRFVLERDGAVTVTGYLRIGGSVEVLGLISVSIELCLSLTYRSERNALVGRATLVIEIDLTLWSDSVELDSGEWVLAGGREHLAAAGAAGAAAARSRSDPLSLWRTYRAAFAAENARALATARALRAGEPTPASTADAEQP
jgi:hypothetical protein